MSELRIYLQTFLSELNALLEQRDEQNALLDDTALRGSARKKWGREDPRYRLMLWGIEERRMRTPDGGDVDDDPNLTVHPRNPEGEEVDDVPNVTVHPRSSGR